MKKPIRLCLAAAVIYAIAGSAHAQTTPPATGGTTVSGQTTQMDTLASNKGQTQVANKIAADFTVLAGSRDNAVALVNALRNGTPATLTASTTGTGTGTTPPADTTITPPTGKMGWGNVFISLALAQKVLTQAGITEPTAADLQAALLGGDIVGADGKTVTLQGVLTLRADGMGWGQIAHVQNTKLGPVVSSIKSANQRIATLPSTPDKGTTIASADGGKATAKTAKAAASASAKSGVTTASGTPASSKGMTTAANAQGHGQSSKGITTASGASASTHGNQGGKGLTTAAGGSAGSAGIVSAEAGVKGNGHAYGRGLVTAAGGNAATVSTAAMRAGTSSSVVSASGAVSSSGITSAHGAGSGQGNGNANGKGHGKGG